MCTDTAHGVIVQKHSLKYLMLEDNQFTGAVPFVYGEMPQLQLCKLQGQTVSGNEGAANHEAVQSVCFAEEGFKNTEREKCACVEQNAAVKSCPKH